MTGVPAPLAAALAGRYHLERALGAGGMATVYLARDAKHERAVAIKVLRPELASVLGADRFLREIRTTATLHHPHILPLYDSGEAEGFFFYVMPYVEGESLRDRLARERQLPLEDALRIAGQVADALSYAHSRGVVHRDVKPENVLLEGDHAYVADFGIARAIAAVGGDKLTQTGISIGTPAYMSPEQAAGSDAVDGRTDVYALGCVLYEMLAGDPPFTSSSAHAVLARHALDPVPGLRTVRATIPGSVEEAIVRALAKTPADRFQTPLQLRDALAARPAGAVPRPRGRWVVAGAVGMAAVVVAAIGLLVWPSPGVPVDPSVLVVAPFRIAAVDPAQAYLREGMAELLALKITGDGGLHAADPGAVLRAWRRAGGEDGDLTDREALRLARSLGAGRLVRGSVMPGARLEVHAALHEVPGGAVLAQVREEGPPDSLTAIADRLTVRLLAGVAQEPERRLDDVASASLPALRAYLDGQGAYRRGHYELAQQRFSAAIERDSAFALAWLGLWLAEEWVGQRTSTALALWRHRDRLNARDRGFVVARLGPRFPGSTPTRERLAAWERAVGAPGASPEAWYQFGDLLFHHAPRVGIGLDEAHRRAGEAFGRAVALDSTHVPALGHLIELAVRAMDSVEARRIAALYFAVDSVGDVADYYRWRLRAVTRETGPGAGRALQRLAYGTLRRIPGAGQLDAVALDDVEGAVEALAARASTSGELTEAHTHAHHLALNRGRPRRALEAVRALEQVAPERVDRLLVLGALYWDGDSAAALDAARRLSERGRRPAGAAVWSYDDLADRCALAQWALVHGGGGSPRQTIQLLSRAAADTGGRLVEHAVCAQLLEAMERALRRTADAGEAVRRLDSVLETGSVEPSLDGRGLPYANLVVARLLETLGETDAALAAARRRPYHAGIGLGHLSSYLREEGRLAAQAGDRTGAIRAYRQFLALRAAPEPELAEHVKTIRRELARLTAETGDRR